MSKSANVFTRVDPIVKAQAEMILEELGLSMSTAMGLFLKQIALQRGLPFEVKLPRNEPTSLSRLTDEEFDSMMDEAITSCKNGECSDFNEFQERIRKELDL